MFWTIIVPELILAWTVRQWYAVWDIWDIVNGTREGGLLSLIRGFETNHLQRTAHWNFCKILVWGLLICQVSARNSIALIDVNVLKVKSCRKWTMTHGHLLGVTGDIIQTLHGHEGGVCACSL